MSVRRTHPQYDEYLPIWKITDACTKGWSKVKALGTKDIPPPGVFDGDYDKDRYRAYLTRAIYTNYTGRTVSGLSGAAFRVAPNFKLAPSVAYLEMNADGAGQSLIQLAKDVVNGLNTNGRYILLSDYPQADEGLSEEQVKNLKLQAHIKKYTCFDLTYWETSVVSGKTILSLATLKECYVTGEGFDKTENEQFRVLRLTDGVYTQQIYRDDEPVTEEIVIYDYNRQTFDRIQLFIGGAQSNDPDVDMPVVSDIAHVNLGHFRNSADLEENAFYHSQMTFGISSDMTSDEWTTVNPSGVQIGATNGIFLGANGHFDSIQADPNQLSDKLMERKEAQMIALGAKIIESRTVQETAAAAKIDAAGENSVLSDVVTNAEEIIYNALLSCSRFMSPREEESEFKLNRQFFPDNVDPSLVMASIQAFDRGLIAKKDFRALSRKAEMIDAERTDEDIDREVSSESPIGPVMSLPSNNGDSQA